MLKNFYKFFFPNDRKIKIEAITKAWKQKDGKIIIHREFHTFRAFYTHYFYEIFINPLKWWRVYEPFKKFNIWQLMEIGVIAFDATANATTSNATTLTFSHTCTGSNLVLTVGVGRAAGSTTVSSITYNSVAMTFQVGISDGTNERSESWYLGSPSTGANNVVVTMSASTGDFYGGAVSFSGANTTTPIDTSGSGSQASGTSLSVSVTTANANSFLVDCFMRTGGTTVIAADAGQTERWNIDVGGTNKKGGGSTKATTTAGSYSMGWSWSNNLQATLTVLAVNEGTTTITKKRFLFLGID